MRIGKKIVLLMSAMAMALMLSLSVSGTAKAAEKQTIYNSPYVSFAPDGKAWTTHAYDSAIKTYSYGETVTTGIASSLRALNEGEHYYKYDREGEVPVSKWVVQWPSGKCIHDRYPLDGDYHGLTYRTQICAANYFSGWVSYCADCNEPVGSMHVYMSKEAAESIDYVESRKGRPMEETDMDYYYLCPFCTNLEQGAPYAHKCNAISYNRYEITYDSNAEDASGEMYESYHLYNNATTYDGQEVTPVTHLNANTFTRVGYEFDGWNTKPDGSGISYDDCAEISNLRSADFKIEDTWHVEADGTLDNGTITLYAQWRKSESTLRIVMEGGTYQGQGGVIEITQEFGTSYTIDVDSIESSWGYNVLFNTNGGTATDYESGETVARITADRPFTGWLTFPPMNGMLSRNVYFFNGPDGSVDEIESTFGPGTIILPNCTKEGYSFGGWYANSALTKAVGGPGDEYTPTTNTTLYASWVELILTTEDNYEVNGGKGAVDLSWEQKDSKDKVYKIYQSTDASTWNQVGSATDIGMIVVPPKTFGVASGAQSFTVPYGGVYNINAYGAQGTKAGSKDGGKGGQTLGVLYLDAGEKLTLTVGSQNAQNAATGGGKGNPYGNGGGASKVVSDKKGTLFVAGGGGGATLKLAGGAGGAVSGLRTDGKSGGESGGAGGGSGYIGGTAGELEIHYCEPECAGLNTASQSFYNAGSGTMIGTNSMYNLGFTPETNSFFGGGTAKDYTSQWAGISYFVGSAREYLETPKSGELSFRFATQKNSAVMGGNFSNMEMKITVYDKDTGNAVYAFDPLNASHTESTRTEHLCDNGTACSMGGHKRGITTWSYTDPSVTGTRISAALAEWQNHDGSYRGAPRHEEINLDFNIPIPEEVKGVYLGVTVSINGKPSGSESTTHIYTFVSDVSYQYSTCGYEDGEILVSTQAYGGSNYVAEEYMNSFNSYYGVRTGLGQISISSNNAGFMDMQKLDGVSAPDLAAPDTIAKSSVKKKPVGSNRAEISWEEPKDNGTPYYHKVESYLKGSTSKLCTSNITLNTLTTGVVGYYYLVDGNAATTVTAANGALSSESSVMVDVVQATRYLHVAAVDKAGNVSGTVHVKISAAPEDGDDILWNLSTDPITMEDTEYTHPGGGDKWYVKADGITPFTLMYDAYLDGTASYYYQPNYSIFTSRHESTGGENILFTKNHAVSDTLITTRAADLVYSTDGSPILGQYPYMVTERSDNNTKLHTVQKFTLSGAYHGKEVTVYPRTGADYGTEVMYSDETADRLNQVILVGDGEAPVITGLESFSGTDVLEISAMDDLSGVGDFYVEVINTDNNDRVTFYPEADGKIRIDLSSGEPMFDGDLQVRAVATDNVGNENDLIVSASEFTMTTAIERLLTPHDPVFKCGESGVLTITTYGYADRVVVEFPPEIETENVYSTEFVYPAPSYMAEEKIQFMVPLYTPSQQYIVKVTAYKNGVEMQRDEPIMVVSGSVLQELRTRLR